tara:strand:- start:1133 stop:1855 length:723 start_codon:yes stop_codon:yes gene_type:complete
MKFFKKIFLILLVITVILFTFKNNFIVNKVEKILIIFSGYTENVLKEVYVSGRINESRANILKAINVIIGESLLTIDLENIRKNLNNLSWVKDSSVYLLPLGQLEIEIYEYIPFGKFTDLNNNTFLINKNGVKFLSINISEFESLFELYGKDALLHVAELPLIINKLKSFNFNASKIERIDSRRWNIYLKEGFLIKLPNINPLNSIDALYKLDNNINYNNLTFVDLRIKDRVSLKYKQVD